VFFGAAGHQFTDEEPVQEERFGFDPQPGYLVSGLDQARVEREVVGIFRKKRTGPRARGLSEFTFLRFQKAAEASVKAPTPP